AIEIGLSTKCKLGFVKGTIVRSPTDANLAELWDTCNNMLERRFSVSDGSRKYRLNKNTYEITQSSCSIEESQRVLFGSSSSVETTALYSRGNVKDKCGICGFKWNPPEKCWEKVGYPLWHSKFKGSQGKQNKNGPVQNKNQFANKTATYVESGNISFTPQQFEQLLKSVQQFSSSNGSGEEIDHHYAVGIACLNSQIDLLELLEDWIYETGASDHMTPDLTTRKVKGLGKLKDGLYHLVNVSSDQVDSVFTSLVQTTLQKFA
ncbi:hypothetical protein Tco_0928493, partial [Tanacetum coccineum]